VFQEFADGREVQTPFPRIPYKESMERYGNDKPDLRIPFELTDVSEFFTDESKTGFGIFAKITGGGGKVIAIPAPQAAANQSRNQYDIVCNGVELSSGAIRNHKADIMYKAFAMAGYGPEVVEDKFAGMINAFKYGAPPHGGIAPGVDRIVMLLAGTETIRDVILFPMNGQAQDLMMNAPAEVDMKALKELHLKLVPVEPKA